MDPPRDRKLTLSSAVLYAGGYNPSSTLDFQRRAREKGVIDLCSATTASLSTASSARGNKRTADQEFSVPNGKRVKKTVHITNLSSHAVTLKERWDEGTFRWVHKARYAPDPMIGGHDGGPQNGELCVLKEFKTGSVYETHFFTKDILAVDKAGVIIDVFNRRHNSTYASTPGIKPIKLNRPKVWTTCRPDATGKHTKKLCEPMLEGKFLKFNSNSGYATSNEYMQALSHYSYHKTGGKYLLCDLQGGHYEDMYILTDPVVMSFDNSKKYGSGDLGAEGIDNFFARHRCGRFCQKHWRQPAKPVKSTRIPVKSATSFSLTLGTKKSEAERLQNLQAVLAKNRRF